MKNKLTQFVKGVYNVKAWRWTILAMIVVLTSGAVYYAINFYKTSSPHVIDASAEGADGVDKLPSIYDLHSEDLWLNLEVSDKDGEHLHEGYGYIVKDNKIIEFYTTDVEADIPGMEQNEENSEALPVEYQ
jgi:hypothetical protein